MRTQKHNILVTGSKGFIGKNLLVELSSVDSYKVDTFNRGESFEILESKILEADAIIHLAAISRDPDCRANPKESFDINIQGTLNLIDATRAKASRSSYLRPANGCTAASQTKKNN